MMYERALFAKFTALYFRPWSYKLLKKSKTLVILGVTGLMVLLAIYKLFLLVCVLFFPC